jgi:hypothetical protein
LARPAITSLTFMLVWVPEPVCQMTSGKLIVELARTDDFRRGLPRSRRRRFASGRAPCLRFTRAAACFTIARAWTMPIGIRSRSPNGKFSIERCVCAPQ